MQFIGAFGCWHELLVFVFYFLPITWQSPRFLDRLVRPYSLVSLEEPCPRIGWQSSPCHMHSSQHMSLQRGSFVHLGKEEVERFPLTEHGSSCFGFGGSS